MRNALRAATCWLACVLMSCTTPTTTRLRYADFELTTQEMAQRLASSDFLAERTPDSELAVVVINKVHNLTTDVIPPAEQWMLMAQLQGALNVLQLARNKNVRFQVPPERGDLIRGVGYRGDLSQAPETTHVMKAVFRSSTRTARDEEDSARAVQGREEYYFLQYEITNIRSREIVWTDFVEFKRAAKGTAIN